MGEARRRVKRDPYAAFCRRHIFFHGVVLKVYASGLPTSNRAACKKNVALGRLTAKFGPPNLSPLRDALPRSTKGENTPVVRQ
jgi:hypothetical protein